MKLQKLLKLLEDARSHATFENASFDIKDVRDAEIKEKTRIFRESWLIPSIDEAIQLVNAEIEKGQNKSTVKG